MPTLKGAVGADGGLVEILLGPSASAVGALRAALRPIPSAIAARALLDTGAELTCVDSSLIHALALPLSGIVLANLPAHGGLTAGVLRDAALTIVHPSGNPQANFVLRNHTVLEVSLGSLGYQCLLGRDVLRRCRFLYDGPRNQFRLRY
jgi:hypothetical protein